MISSCLAASAQTKNISGIVLDEDNEPVVGATVMCKGTNIGAATDIEGRFKLTVPEKAKYLNVTYVGMDPQEVAIAPEMTIQLRYAEGSRLDEVVVVAYGEQKRSSFTGSAGVVKSGDLQKIAVNDPIKAMAGKLPGVQLKTSSGAPTSTPSIQIRGTGSINAGTAPLYIVDGAPMEGQSYMINPEDIESITVLKDAASNALYGARGANGVIMITTKKGKAGPAEITFNAKVGFVHRARQEYDVIKDPRAYYELGYLAQYNHEIRDNGTSAARAHDLANQALFLDDDKGGFGYVTYTAPDGEYLIGQNGKMNPGALPYRIITNNGKSYRIQADDWAHEALRTGLRQDYTVNVSGGINRFNYYATLGYLNDEGIVRNSGYERYTFRLKTNWELRSWLNFNVNMSYVRGTSKASDTGIFSIIDWTAPVYPLYVRDADGGYLYDDNGRVYDYGDRKIIGLKNPVTYQSNSVQEPRLRTERRVRGVLNLTGALDITIPWVKGLKAQIRTGIVENNSTLTSTKQPFYGATADLKGYVKMNSNKTYSFNHQQLITYNNTFGLNSVNLMVGHEYYRQNYNSLTGAKKTMFSYWGNQTLDGAVTVIDKELSGYITEYNTEGWFGRAMYDYDDRYFVSASYRRDASSRFHPDHRWGNFYSFGAAWILTKEAWFPKLPGILDVLKLKASWGQQGNDDIDNYLYTTLYTIKNVNDEVGLEMSTIKGAKDITWETNHNLNVGLEFELFNNRLSGEVEYFQRKTTNMLCQIGVPLDAGYSYQYDNVGDMRNAGVEFSLNFDAIRTRNFTWNIYLNGTHYRNRILRLANENKASELDGHPGYVDGNYFYGEGLSIHSWRLKRFAGVDPATGYALYYKKDAESGTLTTTQSYNDADYFYCGTSDPDFYGGFGTSLSFFGFDVSVQFQYSIGGKAFDNGYRKLMSNPSSGYTTNAYHKDILNAWSETNRNSDIPRYQYSVDSRDMNAHITSDRFLKDASTLSLDNVNIGYTFPAKLMRKAFIRHLRLSVSGDGLWYWSRRKGFDPRNSFWGSPSTTGYSLTRTFTFGAELGF